MALFKKFTKLSFLLFENDNFTADWILWA